MANQPPLEKQEGAPADSNPQPAPSSAGKGNSNQGGGVSAGNGDKPENVIERATENAVKRELRWPETIMAGFTVVIACAAIAQCHEMNEGGIDTHSLANSTNSLYDATNELALAASNEAQSENSLATTSSEQLGALTNSVKAARETATAAKTQASAAQAALVADNRAWLGVTNMAVAKEGDGVYDIGIVIINTGRSPATGVIHRFPNSDYIVTSSNLDLVYFGNNAACAGLKSPPGGDVIYPGQAQTASFRLSGVGPLASRESLVVHGCIAYETLGRVHYSRVCMFTDPLESTPFEQRTFKFCADGNSTD